MKRLAAAGFALLLLTACGGRQKDARIQDLSSQSDSLALAVAEKDSILNDALFTLSDVSGTLDEIKRRQHIVTSTSENAELSKESKAKIKEDLEAINALLQKNRAAIARLQGVSQKLKDANVQVDGLEKLVAELNKQIEERDAEIASLIEQVGKLNIQVESLTQNVTELSQHKAELENTVETQSDALNTAYYIVGPEKELLAKGILTKKGAIGRTLIVNPDLNKDLLTRIDIRQVDRIEIGGKKATVIGSYPAASYRLITKDKVAEALTIQDKDAFWGNSRILVIAYK